MDHPQEGQRDAVAAHLAQGDFHGIGQRVTVEDVGDGIADIQHEHVEAAMLFIRAGAGLVGGLADAGDGSEGAIDEADHAAETDALRLHLEEGAAVLAALGVHVTGPFELGEDLLEELHGEALLGGELVDLDEIAAELLGDADVNECARGRIRRVWKSSWFFIP